MAMLANVVFCCPAECLEQLAGTWGLHPPRAPSAAWFDELCDEVGGCRAAREMRRWADHYRQEDPVHPASRPTWLQGFETWYRELLLDPELRVPGRFGYYGITVRLDPTYWDDEEDEDDE